MMVTINKEQQARCRQILHQTKDEVTGQALHRLLTDLLDSSRTALESAADVATIHRLQGDVRTLRKLITMQQTPITTPTTTP